MLQQQALTPKVEALHVGCQLPSCPERRDGSDAAPELTRAWTSSRERYAMKWKYTPNRFP